MRENILASDLDYILEHTGTIWNELKNKRLFLTGGTGFIGSWLLETFAWANQKLPLNLTTTVLTRQIDSFARKSPHLANNPHIQFQEGDVRNFHFPKENFSHVIHGATDASKHLNDTNPQLMLDTIVEGTRRTLEFSEQTQAQKFLLLSSGAVYGKQPPHLSHLTEHDTGTPLTSAYSIGKIQAENMCNELSTPVKIARCFAFVGPYLPIDIHFAIGNFIRDGLLKKPIFINSDGSSFRSYQYTADLVIWLLHILCHGENNTPYNVGCDQAISIADLARKVVEQFPFALDIEIAKSPDKNSIPERYIPSIQRAQQELGLKNHIHLDLAIQKTIQWHQNKQQRHS